MARHFDCIPLDGKETADSLGGAVSAYIRRRFPRDTAKHAAGAYGVDHETGKSLTRGHVSSRTLARAVRVDGYELLDAVGHALTGLTRVEWERLKITQIQEEIRNATIRADEIVASAERLANIRALRATESGATSPSLGSREDRAGA